jgi:hypothetical protein
MSITSPALRSKIAKAQANAPLELHKARLCTNVILAATEGQEAADAALSELKQGLGNNWTTVTAMQFMSGRRGEFAVNCADPFEKVPMYLAHLVAKEICSSQGLGAVTAPTDVDVAKFKALVTALKAHLM